MKLRISLKSIFPLLLLVSTSTFAQTPPASDAIDDVPEVDEIIAYGKQGGQVHDGLKSFFDGDFEQAEIEFEREFKSLKRGESARENFAIDSDLAFDRAVNSSNATGFTAGNGSIGGGVSIAPAPGGVVTSSTSSRSVKNSRKTGRGVLTDGVVTYEDFAFSKYMSGLSEIQLGKYEEAKKSFKQSLHYYDKNYDAHMRLGLIHIKQNDFKDAAKQLKKLNKMRKKCEKRNCSDAAAIRKSTIELANAITKSATTQQ